MRYIKAALAVLAFANAVQAETREVDVVVPEQQPLERTLQLSGSIEARQVAQLAALESGVVASFSVEVGDVVNQGDVLLQLDDTLVQLELAQAEAALDSARSALSEAERLSAETSNLSQQRLVASTLNAQREAAVALAKAEVERQQALVKIAAERVRRHTLMAPFTGVIAARNVNAGEWVSQQTSVYSLVESNALRANVAIPQEYFATFSSGSPIEARVSLDGGLSSAKRIPVSRFVGVSDPQSRVFTALIDLPQDSGFVPGMSAQIQLSLPADESSVVWLPRSALKQHPDGGASVFSIEDGVARRQVIQIAMMEPNRVAIANIRGGIPYVISGVELLQDGERVTVRASSESLP